VNLKVPNYDAMNLKNKERVQERVNKIEEVCKSFYERREKIEYSDVARETHIPYSTIMKDKYKKIIDKWKRRTELNIIHSSDANKLKAEITYLNNIIKRLTKENNILKTKIFTENSK
jgi:hypothetical protein